MACVSELLWLLLGAVLLIGGGGVVTVRADAMVTGTVFCDQCKDGQRSFLDYPLYGAKVAVACRGSTGAVTAYKEESTNWFGNYAVRFEGSPDMSGCYAQVVGGPSGCGAGTGPVKGLSLLFRMFGMEMYMVDSLLSEPQQPMGFCSRDSSTSPLPSPPRPLLPLPPPPVVGSRPPPLPFLEASACPSQKWMMQEYKCHWKVVGPDTKVAVAFGLVAAGKYGTDMSLWEGLQGRGDLYRTLLREATTALLNSYNSLQFFYPTLSVISNMNGALLGSPQQALMMALRFKRANSGASGSANLHCNFSPCS